MGSRGASSGKAGTNRTAAADKTLRQIAKRTANLKNEQYRIVDDDGNILVESKGDKHSVGTTVGEKRQYMDGATAIHNHPDGGTFSSSDFDDFGFGAKEIVVSTPEGTYSLVNKNMGKPNQKMGWVGLRDATRQIDSIESQKSTLHYRKQAENLPKMKKKQSQLDSLGQQYLDKKKAGASEAVLSGIYNKYDKLSKEYSAALRSEARRLETKVYDDFYKKNASKYGFTYSFTPNKKR